MEKNIFIQNNALSLSFISLSNVAINIDFLLNSF